MVLHFTENDYYNVDKLFRVSEHDEENGSGAESPPGYSDGDMSEADVDQEILIESIRNTGIKEENNWLVCSPEKDVRFEM